MKLYSYSHYLEVKKNIINSRGYYIFYIVYQIVNLYTGPRRIHFCRHGIVKIALATRGAICRTRHPTIPEREDVHLKKCHFQNFANSNTTMFPVVYIIEVRFHTRGKWSLQVYFESEIWSREFAVASLVIFAMNGKVLVETISQL